MYTFDLYSRELVLGKKKGRGRGLCFKLQLFFSIHFAFKSVNIFSLSLALIYDLIKMR